MEWHADLGSLEEGTKVVAAPCHWPSWHRQVLGMLLLLLHEELQVLCVLIQANHLPVAFQAPLMA